MIPIDGIADLEVGEVIIRVQATANEWVRRSLSEMTDTDPSRLERVKDVAGQLWNRLKISHFTVCETLHLVASLGVLASEDALEALHAVQVLEDAGDNNDC